MQSIIVKVNGKEYETYIDRMGTQRFKVNALFRHLVDSKQVDLNQLAIDYSYEFFSKEEYAEFIMGLGTSVDRFADYDAFSDWKIENPRWD